MATNIAEYDFTQRHTKTKLAEFAEVLLDLSNKIGFKVSSRGWCYQLESERYINKNQFNKVEDLINRCRKNGLLPIDFTAEEEGRKFSGIEHPTETEYGDFISNYLQWSLSAENSYTPDWWAGEEYYIQLIVEKIDLKTLFRPVCENYHIPIATSKGWSSMLQRAEYAKRYKQAEDMGMKCVLLYCGDHDPDGLRISDFLRSNLDDLKDVTWEDGEQGYDPEGLIIDRFGLNFEFIQRHKLTWIDNLITGNTQKQMDLGDPSHKNHRLLYVQQYLKKIGRRKCEANSIVPMPKEARELVSSAIEKYLGVDALDRFDDKRRTVQNAIRAHRVASGAEKHIRKAMELL